MRTTGRRTLAGIAAGVLGAGALVLAVAPTAQAAPSLSIYCSNATGGGSAGTAPDVTTIKPDCVLPAGLTTQATFAQTWFGQSLTGTSYLTFTVSGDSTFASGANVTRSTDNKTAVTQVQNLAQVLMNVPTPGTRTVTVTGGPTALVQDQVDLGTITVTGSGAGAGALVNQGYYVVADDSAGLTGPAALAIVHVLDDKGVPLSLAAGSISGLTYNTSGGTVSVSTTSSPTLYRANDCSTATATEGELTRLDPGDTAASDIVTDACDVVIGAGVGALANSGLWVTWTGPGRAGDYSASFNLTVGAQTYPVTVKYTVASTLGDSLTATLDKKEYAKGAAAELTMCVKDVAGRSVADGMGWASISGAARAIIATTNAPVFSTVSGSATPAGDLFTPVYRAATYNGCTVAPFYTPPNDMAAFAFTVGSSSTAANQGWAAAAAGKTATATARIGSEAPVAKSIAIVGSRVEGTSQVIVEGTSEGLVGKTVTPYFRFPGETGFTAGTGVRTVEAEGNFNWQRNTGKKIAVQFRGDGVVSNTVIIDAK